MTEQTRKAGRPPISAEDRLDKVVSFRLPQRDLERLQKRPGWRKELRNLVAIMTTPAEPESEET
jgi:hypothetical protein